jgi:hypothetical protein
MSGEGWPEYVSHKVVRAAKIVRISDDGEGGTYLVVSPAPGFEEPFHTTEPAMMARAEVGGYAVVYEGGFRSVSPAKAFEEGYTRKEIAS